MASDYRCATDECAASTPGDWDSNNAVLALSLRRCRTTAYTSSAIPCFTNMLLSPRPFGFRLVVHLGVMDPELRPPLVAIPSVRDTAHTFASSGSPVPFFLRLWPIEVDVSMARLADRYGHTLSCDHDLHPQRLFPASLFVQVCQSSYMVHLHLGFGATYFTGVSE
jgi:hypothetical protein